MPHDEISMPYHDERKLPRFTLRQIDMPDLQYWEVGGKHYLIMRVEMTAKRNRKDLEASEDKQKIEGDFEVQSIKVLGDKPVDVKSLEKEAFETVVTRARSGEV